MVDTIYYFLSLWTHEEVFERDNFSRRFQNSVFWSNRGALKKWCNQILRNLLQALSCSRSTSRFIEILIFENLNNISLKTTLRYACQLGIICGIIILSLVQTRYSQRTIELQQHGWIALAAARGLKIFYSLAAITKTGNGESRNGTGNQRMEREIKEWDGESRNGLLKGISLLVAWYSLF